MPVVRKYWFPLVGIISLLFIYRFTFTYTFTSATVEGISTQKLLFLESRSFVIVFRKEGTEIRAHYFDDDATFKRGDKVLLIYRENNVSYTYVSGEKLGLVSGSSPLPVFYDSNVMISGPSIWFSNFACWLFVMGILSLIRRRVRKKQPKNLSK